MESRLLLNVVIGEGATILELLSSEDKTLLVRGNSFLVLDLLFHGLGGIRRLNLEGDGLSGEGFHKDLHTTTKTKDQMKSRLLLDVVVGESATILQLLPSEDKTLLVRGNSFLILDLLFHGLDSVRGFDFESDGLSGEGFHKDLHTTTKTEDQMKSRLLLDVVIGESATILELLSSEDKTLLVRGNSFLVLDLLFHGLDGIRRLNLEGDCLSGEGFNEDLHTTTKTEDQVESRLLLDVVIGEGTTILQLLPSENKTLLVRGNSFLILDLLLHGLDGIRRLNLESDGLSGEGFHKDLHDCCLLLCLGEKLLWFGSKVFWLWPWLWGGCGFSLKDFVFIFHRTTFFPFFFAPFTEDFYYRAT